LWSQMQLHRPRNEDIEQVNQLQPAEVLQLLIYKMGKIYQL
jgi:hypothetical protein